MRWLAGAAAAVSISSVAWAVVPQRFDASGEVVQYLKSTGSVQTLTWGYYRGC
ncbi:phosphonate ABC transporter substrate-binding protein [Jonquetella anthropi]|uniref:phosphonate ABC transporter substrate-binding protein n=1 Tax=Jonquetella anthropi TaxID=428712 RepID=UPI001F40FC96|nr:phosphonate ABC transporter substrate-binding protein [Jonquetella anthropi]